MSVKIKTRIAAAVTSVMLVFGLANSASAANIVETAASVGTFKTLLAAATAAGLGPALSTTQNITVFAPTDAAFAKLPKGTVENLLKPENKAQLVAILTYHVLPTRIAGAQVPTKPTLVDTLNKDNQLQAVRRGGSVRVDGARVVKADVAADNGVIHVIDRVLIPGSRKH